MANDLVQVQQLTEGALLVTFNRPEKLNALTVDMIQELIAVAQSAKNNKEIRTVIVTGTGRAFSAGGDITGLFGKIESDLAGYLMSYAKLDDAIADSGTIWISAINGLAYGGGLEIAAMCDIRVSDSRATFCIADIEVGALPTGGLTWKLPRLIGESMARWMMLTNSVVNAQRASEIGLIHEVVNDGECVTRAREIATQVAEYFPEAVSMTREAIRMSWSSLLVDSREFEVASSVHLLKQDAVSKKLQAGYGAKGKGK
jgi:enoyl-CoA hydratase/carnithine racemase